MKGTTGLWLHCWGGGDVILVDSLNRPPSGLVRRQLRDLFRTRLDESGELYVDQIPGDSQPNGSDCGLYAAAVCFQLALEPSVRDLRKGYDNSLMRIKFRKLFGCVRG